MPRDPMKDIITAVFKRKTIQGRLNKLIDALAEENFLLDESLHFTNEVVLHRHVKQHIRNTYKYGVKPRIMKKISKLMP